MLVYACMCACMYACVCLCMLVYACVCLCMLVCMLGVCGRGVFAGGRPSLAYTYLDSRYIQGHTKIYKAIQGYTTIFKDIQGCIPGYTVIYKDTQSTMYIHVFFSQRYARIYIDQNCNMRLCYTTGLSCVRKNRQKKHGQRQGGHL